MKLKFFGLEISTTNPQTPPADGDGGTRFGRLQVTRRQNQGGAGTMGPRPLPPPVVPVPLPVLPLLPNHRDAGLYLGGLGAPLAPNPVVPAPIVPVPVAPLPAPVVPVAGGAGGSGFFGGSSRRTRERSNALKPTPEAIAQWHTLPPDRLDTEIRKAFAVLKGNMRGPLVTAQKFQPMAAAFVDLLPRITDMTERGNAMRWIDAYLSIGRKSADKVETLSAQAPVWNALIDKLPDLRNDRRSQYAILHRLLRQTDVAPGGHVAALRAPLQGVAQRLTTLLARTDEAGPLLRENSQAIVREILGRLGVAVAATAPSSLDTAIANLRPMTNAEAALYRQDLAEAIETLKRASTDEAMNDSAERASAWPLLLYSLGKRLPGLNPLTFDTPYQVTDFLSHFPGPHPPLFCMVTREGAHATAMLVKQRSNPAQPLMATSVLDSTEGHFNSVIESEEFGVWMKSNFADIRSSVAATGLQQDSTSCGVMTMSLIAESFMDFDRTDATLDSLLARETMPNAYVPPVNTRMQFVVGVDAMVNLSAGHLKHLQDRLNLGMLPALVDSRRELKKAIVNKRGMTLEQRAKSPEMRLEVITDNGPRVFNMSVHRSLKRWAERASDDLRQLQSQPDGGAAAWREARIRIAPFRLPDHSVTDRLVGIKLHPAAETERKSELEYVNTQLESVGPGNFASIRFLAETASHARDEDGGA
jgi:hypothetical protein